MASTPAEMDEQTIASLRYHAECILSNLPERKVSGDADALLRQIKELMPSTAAGPWYLSEVEEGDEGDFQTLGPHPAPHYEEMIAQFFPGNHSTAPAEMVLLLMNNLELIVQLLEKHVAVNS